MVLTCIAWTGWIVCRLTIGGMCAKPDLAENFDTSLYLGRWYQMYVAKNVPFQDSDCITATYADKDGTNIQVDNQSYKISDGKLSNWDGTPPNGKPKRYFVAHCSDFTTGHCQVKPFWFNPWNDYKIVGFDPDPVNGYSIVYGCDTFIGGAIKLDWVWIITRSALEINSAAWSSIKTKTFDIFRDKLPQPHYDPDTFFKDTIQGTSNGCVYTPCTGKEVGL